MLIPDGNALALIEVKDGIRTCVSDEYLTVLSLINFTEEGIVIFMIDVQSLKANL